MSEIIIAIQAKYHAFDDGIIGLNDNLLRETANKMGLALFNN